MLRPAGRYSPRRVLANTRVIRLTELLEETTLNEIHARRQIDGMLLSGEVKQFVVGEHIILKTTDTFNART